MGDHQYGIVREVHQDEGSKNVSLNLRMVPLRYLFRFSPQILLDDDLVWSQILLYAGLPHPLHEPIYKNVKFSIPSDKATSVKRGSIVSFYGGNLNVCDGKSSFVDCINAELVLPTKDNGIEALAVLFDNRNN